MMVCLPTVLLGLIVLMVGCQRQEQQLPPKVDTTRSHSYKKETAILVPAAVQGKWKAVKIAVVDKASGRRTVHTVPVGGKIQLPSSSLTIEVQTFLPAFVKEGSKITSTSNELKNPGAKVVIMDDSTVVLNGWLFSLFPNVHSSMHPRYGFALVDVVPAGR